jgi:ABC-type phosphate transport system ATPase subunit
MLHGSVVEFTPTPQFFTNPRSKEAEHFIAGRDVD